MSDLPEGWEKRISKSTGIYFYLFFYKVERT